MNRLLPKLLIAVFVIAGATSGVQAQNWAPSFDLAAGVGLTLSTAPGRYRGDIYVPARINDGWGVGTGILSDWHYLQMYTGGNYMKGRHGVNNALLFEVSRRVPRTNFYPTVGYRISNVKQPYVGLSTRVRRVFVKEIFGRRLFAFQFGAQFRLFRIHPK